MARRSSTFAPVRRKFPARSEEHTSELQSHDNLVCRLLLEKKNIAPTRPATATFGGRPRPAAAPRALRPPLPLVTGGGCRPCREYSGRMGSFFFLKEAPTPELSPLPHPGALPI